MRVARAFCLIVSDRIFPATSMLRTVGGGGFFGERLDFLSSENI
ncbi:hypothetical protein [Pararhizobium antarcticum]|nr:hypothetical protein [Pararhizobium antarcticum]